MKARFKLVAALAGIPLVSIPTVACNIQAMTELQSWIYKQLKNIKEKTLDHKPTVADIVGIIKDITLGKLSMSELFELKYTEDEKTTVYPYYVETKYTMTLNARYFGKPVSISAVFIVTTPTGSAPLIERSA